ncbi:hypothetical protein LTR35_009065 [Friedmanniomyces endolithicus]|uniref:Uncharacterized protein n=1 Tax=Friedmanniomyces endolithicus TaxID=329885 RepID=A0AAN6JEY1_9PEZI|nr:hypothetical protein LTR35_009065 [Friedmanniomyces endolithicus]KAK0295368.1 hypothetical protein LTS00_005998 [Friedmanniomyces endolithicus]KAK0327226.1 hypothetical protein LTR82_001989 [Friedmanniomyces endolithicus]KAK1016570.1 hypothetical protein LTR54_003249 [Friedmanniomyces endolithicus]
MDLSRASSLYSNDSSRKPTLLDYGSSVDTGSRAGSVRAARDYVESLSSTPSRATQPAPSISSASSKPSSRPSYMNYQETSLAASKRTEIVVDTQISAPPSRYHGTLLVLIVAEIHPQAIHFVRTWLKRWPFEAISVVGTPKYEAGIKQLKMEIYRLTGKLGWEVSVHTHLQAEWNSREIAATLDKLQAGSAPRRDVRGVLCCISYGSSSKLEEEVLRLEEAELAESWQQSVGCLHSAATAIIPRLQQSDAPQSDMFLVLEPSERSPVAVINKAACDALLDQLRTGSASKHLSIDHAERVLLPELEPEVTNGTSDDHHNGYHADDTDFAAFESPTKLWAMWQNEEGGS